MASTPSQVTAVPLRPELFEFIGVQGLGRLAVAALRDFFTYVQSTLTKTIITLRLLTEIMQKHTHHPVEK